MNPARTLLEIFERWAKDSTERLGWYAREGATLETLSRGVEDLYLAARCIREISGHLDTFESLGKDVSRYRVHLCYFVRAIQDSFNGQVPDPRTVDYLPFFVELLETNVVEIAVLKSYLEENSQTLTEQLTELIQAFLDDSTLDLTLRNHAVALCKEILADIKKSQESGFYDFNDSIRLLRIYVDAAAERSGDESRKGSFRKFNEVFLKHPLAPSVLGGVVGYLGGRELGL